MKKIVLAYSGGLDTSVILKWLQNKYNCPIVTFTADIGQEKLSPVEKKQNHLELKKFLLKIYKRNLLVIMYFPCLEQMLFMKELICWELL